MATVHFTTISSKPNTANRHEEKPHILAKFVPGLTILAVFILETDYPSGRTWASLFIASGNSSEYKYGHKDELSVQTNFLRCAPAKM